MSSSALTLVNPGQKINNDQREDMLGYVKESKKFLRAAGYKDKYINSVKIKDLQNINKKASEKITVNNFEKWVEGGIQEESIVRKLFRKVAKPLTNLGDNINQLFKKKNRY